MNKSVIKFLTATHNHQDMLKGLYHSLVSQTIKDFTWIIVDDGSNDGTGAIVDSFIKENKIPITYIYKENGGKSSAINKGLDYVEKDNIVVLIDDDEALFPNAIETIHQYYDMYYMKNNIGTINFLRVNKKTGLFNANYAVKDDIMNTYIEFRNKRCFADGYTAYFGYAVADKRFPLFAGEKYVGPSVLTMLVNQTSKMIWASKALGANEYLEGGITHQGRKLRIRNPKGMMIYCTLLNEKPASLFTRIKYSIHGYSYYYISGMNESDLLQEGIDISKLMRLMRPLGYLLMKKWMKDFSA